MRRALLLVPFLLVACGPAGDSDAFEPIGNVEEALTVCAGKSTVKGVDVSYYQGTIDWGKVKNAGYGFGIARIGDGTYIDPKFSQNWSNMKKAGLVRGAYQFFRANDDATKLASIVVGHVGKLGEGDLPVTLDVEASDGASKATMVNKIKTWMTKVEAGTGRKPMIYTAAYFWNSAVGSTGFSANPLWVANWGVSCPSLPNGWKGFRMWQTTDSGSVPGIGGSVDRDVFNGTKAELLAFAAPPNLAPKGKLGAVECKTGIAGWAQDPDTPAKSIDVSMFFDAAAGKPGAIKVPLTADVHRDDLCKPLGSCNHGYEMPVPRGLRDGTKHPVHAYGVDSDGGPKAELAASPDALTCAPPALPLDAQQGLLRALPVGGMDAWKLSKLFDLAHEPDATLAPYAKGNDWPAKPKVLRAEPSAKDAYLIDGTSKRHAGAAALKAWRLVGVVEDAAPGELDGYADGPALPPEPFLVKGATGGIRVVDYADPNADWSLDGSALPGAEEQDGLLDDDPTPDEAPDAAPADAAADDTQATAGCAVAPGGDAGSTGRRSAGSMFAIAMALAALAAQRRSRTRPQ